MKIDANRCISSSYDRFWSLDPIHRPAAGNIQLNDVILLLRGVSPTLLRNGISPPCMIIKSFESYAVLLTPAADFETAGSTILNQIEPFLIRTFKTFLCHLELTPSCFCGVSVHRAVERFDDKQTLSAKFRESADASPVKKIIARILKAVKPAGYSSLTDNVGAGGHYVRFRIHFSPDSRHSFLISF